MKSLTLWQPWASAIAWWMKHYEIRHWKTSYRGLLAIHAAKRPMSKDDIAHFKNLGVVRELIDVEEFLTCAAKQSGCIVAVCQLVDCIEMNEHLIFQQSELELKWGHWSPGRYAWKLERIRPCNPIPCRGNQRLKDVPTAIVERIYANQPK